MHLGAFCEASAPDTRARAARRAERSERRARGKSTLLHAKLNGDNQLRDATWQLNPPTRKHACRESFVDFKRKKCDIF